MTSNSLSSSTILDFNSYLQLLVYKNAPSACLLVVLALHLNPSPENCMSHRKFWVFNVKIT